MKFNFDIMKRKKLWFAISIVIIVVGLVCMIAHGGLNLGIDYKGGSVIQIDMGQKFNNDEVRDVLDGLDLKEYEIKDAENGTQLIIRTVEMDTEGRQKVFKAVQDKFELPDEAYLSGDNVSSVVGKELTQKALLAVLIAVIGMLIYVTIRFEFWFGVAAILALVHDVLVTFAVFAILNITIDITFIAAILTIVGYSINNTIIIFDRFRENMRKRKKDETIEQIANNSVNQTLIRTLNTSFTTIVVMVCLFVLGGESIRFFAFALLVGLVAGTYSSIFISSPLYTTMKNAAKSRK